jgi:hypothetical protein
MFIRKSRINEAIGRARDQERKLQEKEWKHRLDKSLAEQRELYELQLNERALQINTLESIIENNKRHMDEANEKEMNSKRIYLKAREIISCVDFEYKKSLENHARSMSQMDKIRHESDQFAKQLINK